MTDKDTEQQEDVSKRESLLNNAWRERAFEKLATTPVREYFPHRHDWQKLTSVTGALSVPT